MVDGGSRTLVCNENGIGMCDGAIICDQDSEKWRVPFASITGVSRMGLPAKIYDEKNAPYGMHISICGATNNARHFITQVCI